MSVESLLTASLRHFVLGVTAHQAVCLMTLALYLRQENREGSGSATCH